MPSASSSDVKFEIGHVLFIDIVGYSKLLISEQSAQLEALKKIVRGTEQFRLAETEGKLLRLPTGDGGALVFRTTPEAPVLCALEISKELKTHPELKVRMGIHSGPVNEITDLNEHANIAGAGINIAQRVMDCGDAGHILLSRHVAEDLEQYPRWQAYLHDLGEWEVKHGLRVGIVNLSADGVGNAEAPKKFQAIKKHRARVRWAEIAVALLVLGAIVAALVFFLRTSTRRPPLAVVEKSIAILPFENLSRDPDNAFFADGVQDEILTHLAKIADLKVISRSSVMQYKSGTARDLRKIGEELGVAHVVEGSVQRADNKVRVNAQLIDARSDAHLWAQTYDRDLADVFAIQSEIAKAIADQLRASLSPREKTAIEQAPTNDVTAFDLYARAEALMSRNAKASLLAAADLLNQAVTRDPSFFNAYCLLATSHDQLYFLGHDHTPARLALAEAAIEAAFRLRPDAGEAHLARAQNLYRGYLDYGAALAELEIAAKTLPNNAKVFELKGYIERLQGKQDEALHSLERAVDLDPRRSDILQQIAISYRLLHRFAEQKAVLDRGLAIDPNNLDIKLERAAVDLYWKADPRPLRQMVDSIRSTNPAATQDIAEYWLFCALAERDASSARDAVLAAGGNPAFTDETVDFSRSFMEGIIARMTKDDAGAFAAFTAAHAEQQKILQAPESYGPALCVLGLIDAGLGRKEEALRQGRRAVELLPVEKDAIHGNGMVEYFAMIAAWVGEKDLACDQLAIAVRLPSPLTYGHLKLMPQWDPLRGDTRFEKIVASLAPK
jgi:TolB-like protein/Tfp pilus assembly protein PilF